MWWRHRRAPDNARCGTPIKARAQNGGLVTVKSAVADSRSCMAVDIVTIGLDLIERYGLIAIFILLVLDGAMLLPVFPGELVLLIAVGTYATDPTGLMMLIALSSAAGLVGGLMLYGVTRGGGRKLVERYPRFFMMPHKRRERLERWFQHPFGQSMVMFLRLFPLTRVLVSIPAGLARMPVVRFIVLSTIGMVAYHGAFLWFAYEARRPGSTIEAQTSQLRAAYANPVWDFVQTNAIITGVAIILIGAVLSIRSSQVMLNDPEETTGSFIGSLATTALFWGGMALGLTIYIEPETIFSLMEAGGIDIEAVSNALGFHPVGLLAGIAVASVVLGWALRGLRRSAKKRHKQRILALHQQQHEQRAVALQTAIRASQARIEARRQIQRRPRPPSTSRPAHDDLAKDSGKRRVEFGETSKRRG